MDKSMKENWEIVRDEAIEDCAKIWPEIKKLRKQLNELTNLHGKAEVRRLEAEHHLVPVTRVEKEKKALGWMERIAKLSPKQRERLAEALGKAAELMEEE